MLLHVGIVSALVSAGLVMAAEDPLIGTWKLDPSKSQLTGTTFKYEDAGGGKIRYSHGDDSYWFTTDGVEHKSLYDRMVSVKQTNPTTWERTSRLNGKVLGTTTLKLSNNGKTLTQDFTSTRPDGSHESGTDVYERVGTGSGFLGTWKNTQVKENSPAIYQFEPNGADGVSWNIPSYQAKCPLKYDGKDYPATGPTIPKGMTLAVTKTNPRSFDLVQKVNGKPVFKGSFTVLPDGKTLSMRGSPTGVNEPTTAVYIKQ